MDCIFCHIISKESPADIVYEDADVIAFLDKFPQSRGHLQLIPKKHCRWIYELPDIGKFFGITQKLIRVIIPVLGADHVTFGTFGHQIEHAHLWIVPQYRHAVSVEERKGMKSASSVELAELLRQALNSKFRDQNSKRQCKHELRNSSLRGIVS